MAPHDVASALALALEHRRAGRWDAAEILQRAIGREPSDPPICRALGSALVALGQLDQAEAACRKASRRRPTAATHC